MQIVDRRHDDRIRLHLVEHLDVIAEEFDARRDPRLRLRNQFRVRVGNGHQLGVRSLKQCIHPVPHVIVVKTNDGETRLGRLGKSHAYSQAEEKKQEEQLFHGNTFWNKLKLWRRLDTR